MSAIETILLRNEFYRDRYKVSLIFFILLLTINLVLAGLVIHIYTSPRKNSYIPATNDFRLINTHPMNDPVVSDSFVLQFATRAIQQTYNVDFMHWQKQLETASENFTNSGWEQFIDKFKSSNNLSTILKFNMVTDSRVVGSPIIQQKGIIGSGYYAWSVKVPVLVTYYGYGKLIKMPMSVVLLIMRQPVAEHADRIAINNFIANTVDA